MNIRCNDQNVQIDAKDLATALLELGYQDAIVATAVNGVFVPVGLRATTRLRTDDRIDVLAPMQGG